MKEGKRLFYLIPALAFFAAMLGLGGASASAQVAFTGQITGIVTDSSQAVVPHAKVSVQNVRTNVVTETQTNDSGIYRILSVIPGTYRVTVEQQGFKKFVREQAIVEADATVRVDATLEVGAATQQVTVTAAAPILKTDRADTSQNVGRSELENLPAPGRNITKLVLLAPGMVHTSGELQTYVENPGEDYGFYVNGQYYGNASKTLDGVQNQEVIQGYMMMVPSADSVQEMKVTTNSFDVEIGQAASAAIQVITRSGSNAFHGSAFEFYKGNSMFARDPFSEPNGPARNVWNQFGGTLGGPIKKDKLFFFADYQGMRNATGASTVATVPTAAFRTGDFGAYRDTYPIYDPLTGDPVTGAGRTQFADISRATASNPQGLNIIPLNRITAQATKILDMIPMPTDPTQTDSNFAVSGVGVYNMNQYTARIDYNHSAKTRITGKFGLMRAFYDSVGAFELGAGGPTLGGDGRATASTSSTMFDYMRVISPTFMVDTRFGFTHEVMAMHALDEGISSAEQVGIPGINTGSVNTSGMPYMDIQGPVGAWWLGDAWLPFYENESPLSVVNIWTKVAGNHSLKWGGQIEKFYFLRQDSNGRGYIGVSQALTGSPDFDALPHPGGVSSGLGMASFLVGDTSSYSRRIAGTTSLSSFLPQEQQWRDGLFVQDTWAVTPKLTATFGLRWEFYSPVFGPEPGTLSNTDYTTGNYVVNVESNKYMGIDPNYKEFAPRLGLAYRLKKDTVIRAGAGRSFGLDLWGLTNCWPSAFWPSQQSQSVSQPNAYASIFNFTNGPPAPAAIPAIPANGLVPIPGGVSTAAYGTGPYYHSYVDSWNLTVQHQLAPSLTLEVAYVGNVGRNLAAAIDINLPPPGPGDYNSRKPYYALYGWTQGMTLGHAAMRSAYHGLQARIEKRFSSGLEFMSNFTWSKAMDMASSALNTQNQFNLRGEWGPSTMNRRLLSTSSFVYQLPFGPGKQFASNAKGVVGHVIGGWQMSGIVALTSGLPLTISWGDNSLLNSPMTQRPDRIASGELSNPTRDLWYDPTAFIRPPELYTFGNSGRGILEGPGWSQTDLGLDKSFKLNERFNLHFRWEAMNAFNRTNLYRPNRTASSSTAGKITAIETPMRRMQIGLRLTW